MPLERLRLPEIKICGSNLTQEGFIKTKPIRTYKIIHVVLISWIHSSVLTTCRRRPLDLLKPLCKLRHRTSLSNRHR